MDAAQRTLCFKSPDAVKLVKALHGQEELTIRNPEESSQPAYDGKVTQKLAQRLWERIPKKPEQPCGHNSNLVTSCACQVRRRSKHSISWARVIFSQAWTTLTILTTESLFRGFLITIAFVDHALVKETKMAETLRAQGPPQVRLLMAGDWPSDVPVPSKKSLCASAQHKRFATTLFTSVPREPFNYFLGGGGSFLLFRCSCLLCFCVCPGLASPFRPRGLGVPGFFPSVCRSCSCPVAGLFGVCFAWACLSRACFFPVFLGSLARHMGVDE